jgi:hypothetical protein
MRHAAGSEDHPTASMFVQLYRLLSIYSLLRLPRRRANTHVSQPLQPVPVVLHSRSSTTARQSAVQLAAECMDGMAAFADDECLDAVDVPPLPVSSASTKDNIVFYVAGFVVRHCVRVLSCATCIAALSGEPSNLPQAALINTKLRGALRWPSQALFVSLREAEDYVSAHLANGSDPEAFTELLEQTLPAFLPLRRNLCSSHASSVCAEVAVYFIVTRLHWFVKDVNRSTSAKQTKQHRKKAKLC